MRKNKSVRIPKQTRSVEKRGRIIRTAQRLFSMKGIHGTTSNEIASKAKVSIGTFYSYFKDKNELLREVLHEFLNKFSENIYNGYNDFATGSTSDIRSSIRVLLVNTFKAFEDEPEFHRQMFALKYSDPGIKMIFDEVERNEINFIQALLLSNSVRIKINDIEEASKLIHSTIENAGHSIKLLNYSLEEERMIDELTDMIYKYISYTP